MMAKDNILQFPTDKVKVDNTSGLAHEAYEHMVFAENLAEGLVSNIINNMKENGIDVNSPDFLRDMAFLVELMRSMVHREGGLYHPLQEFTKLFVFIVEDENGDTYLDVDLEMIQDMMSDDMEEFEDE